MIRALTALGQLKQESDGFHRQARLPPANVQAACKQLAGTIESFRKLAGSVDVERPRIDVAATWSMFVASAHDLNSLDALRFRALCSSEDTALRPEFIHALTRNPGRLKRSGCLYGLVGCYFSQWRGMTEPNAVEALILRACGLYGGKNPVVQCWLRNQPIFSAEAASHLTKKVVHGRLKVDDVLREHHVGLYSKLALVVRAESARSAVAAFLSLEHSQSEEFALQYLDWMITAVFSDLTMPDAFGSAVSSLILCESARRWESFRRGLRSYIQSHPKLGDPRLRESVPKWRTVGAQASERYMSWLAAESIKLFFETILPDSSENRRRKQFWLQYHGKIRDFQVALSDADYWKVMAMPNRQQLPSHSRVKHATTSAFLMVFEGYGKRFIAVEFSETGNAAYVFPLSEFDARDLSIRDARFELGDLRVKVPDTVRIIHIGDWESRERHRMSQELGIRP